MCDTVQIAWCDGRTDSLSETCVTLPKLRDVMVELTVFLKRVWHCPSYVMWCQNWLPFWNVCDTAQVVWCDGRTDCFFETCVTLSKLRDVMADLTVFLRSVWQCPSCMMWWQSWLPFWNVYDTVQVASSEVSSRAVFALDVVRANVDGNACDFFKEWKYLVFFRCMF